MGCFRQSAAVCAECGGVRAGPATAEAARDGAVATLDRHLQMRVYFAEACPQLFDVAVGHSGDVVGYGAGQAFGWNLSLVVGGQNVGSAIRAANNS